MIAWFAHIAAWAGVGLARAHAAPFVALLAAVTMALTPGDAKAQNAVCYGRPITTLDFRAPVRISGTANSVGAVYRFSNVATGIDARVRINAITDATLAIIDRDTDLIRNFQPELSGGAPGSIDFTISFVVAGTTTPIAISFAASGIDIDGDSANLREYSEFSNPFTAYVLDAGTNLEVNDSGPSVAANTRFESATNFTAPGIDPTATRNIVSVLYSSTSSFNYRIGSLGSGATTRLTSLDFSCPSLPLPAPTVLIAQDFGDAPASYGNPVHDINALYRMGATNTAEPARYNSPTASGDLGDDGVTLSQLRRSTAGSVTVQAIGVGGRLQAWIDFNGNGLFTDAGEQVAINMADNGTGDTNPATGVISFAVTPPSTAVLTQVFARFRWSSTTNLTPTGLATNGEVEDYALMIWGNPALTVVKSSAVYDPAAARFLAVPGNDVVYTLTTTNTGTGPPDPNSVFVVDSLPQQLIFFNGDFNGAAPGTAVVEFVPNGSTLTFDPATNLRFSNATARPSNLAACTYTPAAGYDPNVRHICFAPQGTLPNNTGSSFTFRLRAKIR